MIWYPDAATGVSHSFFIGFDAFGIVEVLASQCAFSALTGLVGYHIDLSTTPPDFASAFHWEAVSLLCFTEAPTVARTVEYTMTGDSYVFQHSMPRWAISGSVGTSPSRD